MHRNSITVDGVSIPYEKLKKAWEEIQTLETPIFLGGDIVCVRFESRDRKFLVLDTYPSEVLKKYWKTAPPTSVMVVNLTTGSWHGFKPEDLELVKRP